MKKAIALLATLSVLGMCFANVAFATDGDMVSRKSVDEFEKNAMFFMDEKSMSVHLLSTLKNRALNGKHNLLIDIDVLNTRATGSVTWDIPAGTIGKGKTPFSLEAGESVTINCSYSPRSASVDFGLIAPDGRFYYMAGEDGSVNREIVVEDRGEYYLAIGNNSNSTVSVYGFVSY